LLERKAEQIAQTFLTHADQHAPYAHAISNLSIYGIGFFRHSFIGGVDLPELSRMVIELKDINNRLVTGLLSARS
jgi:hypothetical protein